MGGGGCHCSHLGAAHGGFAGTEVVLGMADFEDMGLLTLLSNAGPRGACAGAS